MSKIQIFIVRFSLLGLVLAAWELLPRHGIVNPLLLPPLGDVLVMLGELLQRGQVREALGVSAFEVTLAFVIAVPLGAALGVLIAEIDEIPEPIAAAELDGNIVKLSSTGEFRKEWMERSLDMARLIGMTTLAPVEQMYVDSFKPVPTT